MIVILILLIIGASAFIGWQIKNYYVCREKFFNDQILFCEILLSETNFNKTPLKHIIQKNEKQFHKDFLKCLKMFEKSLEQSQTYSEKSLLLKQTEKENLNLFLNGLGKTNLENHNNLIKSYQSNIKSKIEKEMIEEKKKGNAIFKISICIGMAVAILCV